MKNRVFTLLLGVVTLLSMILMNRAEASAIPDINLQNYTARGNLGKFSLNCQSTGNFQSSSPPGVGLFLSTPPVGFPPISGFLSVAGTGNIGLSSGSLSSSVSGAFAAFVNGSASATMVFGVSNAAEISVNCLSRASTNLPAGPASFRYAITSQVLLSCFSERFLDLSVNSGTLSLNPKDTDALSTSATVGNLDGAHFVSLVDSFLVRSRQPLPLKPGKKGEHRESEQQFV